MKAETIKAIFTNLLFVIGVILLIFGFVSGSQTVVKLASFENYPLGVYDDSRCDYEPEPLKMVATDSSEVADDSKAWKEKCQAGLEMSRRVKKTEDIVGSFTTLVAGGVLVFSFRRFIFKD